MKRRDSVSVGKSVIQRLVLVYRVGDTAFHYKSVVKRLRIVEVCSLWSLFGWGGCKPKPKSFSMEL
jgi:hypothetical protein